MKKIRGAYKKVDINEMLRSLNAQCAIETVVTICESLHRTPFQEELLAIFYCRNNNTYSQKEIDDDKFIIETSVIVRDRIIWD